MSTTPRALCIHDLSCLGRCSLAVIAPVLSACNVQACMLPTALLSTHTGGFGTMALRHETDFCKEALAHYTALGLSFDAVYSGYLSCSAQAQLVQTAFAQSPDALKLVDPVLGDGGKLYSAITSQHCDVLLTLCQSADVLVPNVTESAVLLGLAPQENVFDEAALAQRMAALLAAYPHAKLIVLTGAQMENGQHGNVVAKPDAALQFLPFVRTPQHYPGTGDLFATVLLGGLLHGLSCVQSVQRAADFVSMACAATAATQADARFGVQFEPFLSWLCPAQTQKKGASDESLKSCFD